MTVTFCGHSEVHDWNEVRAWLKSVIRGLIGAGATQFYSGGYGGFDRLVAGVLREMKGEFPRIESILVLAYLDRPYDKELYDDATYPPIESTPKRFAIAKRNQYMVAESNVVVAYVTYGWGGASKTLAYAKRKKKAVMLYPNTDKKRQDELP